ncbi:MULTISPECIES: hypothetical protein [Shouchella]|uniref:Sodium:proton antiporter n=3 Tax=Bacillaceae TaxID=186817 RepID=A0A060LWG1_9BACI|nr:MULTISPECIES: hypothetical protein [Bacillaceae]RQW20025.1 hypothetical protein EH196_07755 [Bacillus sp. C1-1]AIC94110.1 hypothetical protein BleG1_1532 [Shouchella lehensis G1]KQL57967.1 hypothetical protein AN965_06495 [Alkalicoccobacillus plakortidis]MBG9785737.1 hypothetical protein [Shouchella lehensis]TES48202.1 hypothetical protein E2L03_13845 [Shouchella lehensis]
MKQACSILSILVIGISIYKYRYKIVNGMMRQPGLRRVLIRFALRIPFVRQKLMGSLFSFPHTTEKL